MEILAWCLFVAAALVWLAYRRVSLGAATLFLGALLLAYWTLGHCGVFWKLLVSLPVVLLALLNLRGLRMRLLTRPFLKGYLRLLPTMSSTEREALEAGTVWWDGELFTGGPDWQKLMQIA